MSQEKINEESFIPLVPKMGYCFATNLVMKEGLGVGYMYRETPDDETDSGWRFFSGTEDEAYIEDENNIIICDVNQIANYDRLIIPYLKMPVGTELERNFEENKFDQVEYE